MLNFGPYVKRQQTLAVRIMGGNIAAAEEACEEARTAVVQRSLANHEPIVLFWPYLRRATVNACYKRLRRLHRARLHREQGGDRFVIAEAVDPATAAMIADVLLTSDRIVRKNFEPLYTDIFRLRYHDGLSVREIAVRMSLSVPQVKYALRSIIALLRRRLLP